MGNWKKKLIEDLETKRLEIEVGRKKVLTESILGKGHVIKETVNEPIVCDKCGGWGLVPSGHTSENIPCAKCDGEGEIWTTE